MIAKRIAQFLVLVNTILVIPATAAAFAALSMGSWDTEALSIKIVLFSLWSLGISLLVFYIRMARAKNVKFPRIWWSLSALANGIPTVILWNDSGSGGLITQVSSEYFIAISIFFVTTGLSIIALLNERQNPQFCQTTS